MNGAGVAVRGRTYAGLVDAAPGGDFVCGELGVVHLLVTLAAAGMIGGQLLADGPSRSPAPPRMVTAPGPPESGLLVLVVGVVPGPRRPSGRSPLT